MRLNPESIARASSRHPWRTLGIWLVLIATMGFISSRLLGDVLTQEFEFTNEPESVRAQEVIDRKLSQGQETASTEFFIVESESLPVDHPRFEAAVRALQQRIVGIDGEILAGQPYTYYDLTAREPERAQGLMSRDGRGTLIGVPLRDVELSTIEELRAVADEEAREGFTVQVAGQGVMFADFTEIAEEDLRRGETIGIAIALIVLVVVFASILAAIVPIVMAVFAIAVALGLVSLIGQAVEFNLFVTNMVSMIGLAVGIDYSLFIVSRYREERKKGYPKLEAIGASGATANRAVFFSGLTVVLALLGMFIVPA
jgi:RND superfamily putative drug exporter